MGGSEDVEGPGLPYLLLGLRHGLTMQDVVCSSRASYCDIRGPGRSGLRIKIDEEDTFPLSGPRRSHPEGYRRLAHSPFAVQHGKTHLLRSSTR